LKIYNTFAKFEVSGCTGVCSNTFGEQTYSETKSTRFRSVGETPPWNFGEGIANPIDILSIVRTAFYEAKHGLPCMKIG
jgi:hypothetical protein